MSEEVNYLEMARADRSMWLMKCPTVVSSAWQEATAAAAALGPDADGANPNPVVAKIILSFNPLRDNDTPSQIKMEMTQASNGNTPKSYSLNMHSDFVPMCIFSESNQGWSQVVLAFLGSLVLLCICIAKPMNLEMPKRPTIWDGGSTSHGKLACEGKVEQKIDMNPHRENLMDYGKLCRERTNMSMVKTRRMELILDDNGKGMRPMPGNQLVPPGRKDKKKRPVTKPIDMKRTRMDRGQLENILFKLFERQPNWTLKQLIQETNQPEQFLKEILNELCVYNKGGPNQGTHELKSEYKKSTGDSSTN